jgi:hypothetical protein
MKQSSTPIGTRAPAPPVPELAGIDENTQTSNQEAIPVPYLAGEFVVPLRWISPIYNQAAREAPAGSSGKK